MQILPPSEQEIEEIVRLLCTEKIGQPKIHNGPSQKVSAKEILL